MTTVIYHSADFDGLFCREIARKFLAASRAERDGKDVGSIQLIGWDYGDDIIAYKPGTTIYVLDLDPSKVFGLSGSALGDLSGLNWIDHHKSSIESLPDYIPGYRIDGVAACRLAWQWFIQTAFKGLPSKEMFVERMVNEPLAVRLAGEYDVWDKRDPSAELFQHGLRSRELTSIWWSQMLRNDGDNSAVVELLQRGESIAYAREQEYREVITKQGFDIQFEGLKFLACNSHELDIRSHLFAAGIKPHHDALLGFTYNGRDWRVSLYGVPGKPDIDLSIIAKKYGGGGHRQACGMRMQAPPWLYPADCKPEFAP